MSVSASAPALAVICVLAAFVIGAVGTLVARGNFVCYLRRRPQTRAPKTPDVKP